MAVNADFSAMILLILRTLNVECDTDLLIGCVESAGFSDRYEYLDCIEDLMNKALVIKSTVDNKQCYLLTKSGNHVCTEIEDIYLSQSSKREAVNNAVAYYEAIKTGVRYKIDLVSENDGYKLIFIVVVNDRTILEVATLFSNFEIANKALKHCKSHTDLVFNNITAVVSGDLDIFSL